MGTLGIVLGVFLMFSAAVAWIGGDREKAFLEDTVKEKEKAQTEMSAEVDLAKNEASRQDERMKELQDRLDQALGEKKKLERFLALEERNKRIADENKSSGGLWDSGATEDSGDGQDNSVEGENGAEDARVKAAEESLRMESAARAEAEKKLVIEARALQYLETELNETLNETGKAGWAGAPLSGAAFCPWDPGRR